MNRSRKLFRMSAVIMIVLLLWISAFYIYVRKSIEGYNDTVRSDREDLSFSVTINPRGGETDSWIKGLSDETKLTGTIFELKAKNNADSDVSSWSEKIVIHQDCYLNNGWCGKFEVHQFVDGVEKTQVVDLRNYNIDDITLEHLHEGQDLMITLHSGDYIVYLPSAEVYETPMASDAEVTVGLILYYADESFDFSDCEANFYLNKSYKQTTEYRVFMISAWTWGIMAIVWISLFIFSLYTERELRRQDKSLEESISIFSGFVDAKDTYTNGHSKRVALYAQKIAKAMGYNDRQCRDVYYIGLMHDCGKCYIPDEILKKPGPLTAEEFAVIKSHTSRGAELLEGFKSLEHIRDGALYHHERFDGKGYPEGKAGKDIPEIGRILCIADSFDAMNSRRVYRGTLSAEKIRSELENGRGTQFDPDIMDVFIKLLDAGEIRFSSPEKA